MPTPTIQIQEAELFHGWVRHDMLHGHPPDTVVAMALAYHAFKTGRQPGDYGVTI